MQHPLPETILLCNGETIYVKDGDFKPATCPFITRVEKGQLKQIAVHTPNADGCMEQLKSCYDKFIIAAGGLVKNEAGELLVIFRNGKWDLPKGKIEKHETVDSGALREVQEETGLKNIKLLSEFHRTYHTYEQDNKRILKETVWYLMQASGSEATRPQQSEGITRIEWVNAQRARKLTENTYGNIALLIRKFFP